MHGSTDGPGEQALLRALFEDSPVPAWIFERETHRFLAVNDAALRQYGYSREEFLALTLEEIRPPEEVPVLHAALASGEYARFVHQGGHRHRRKDGTLLDVELTAQEVAYGGERAVLAQVVDVTARKRAEERQRFLLDAGIALLSDALDHRVRLASLARLSVPMLGDYCLVDLVEDGGRIRRVEAAHADPEKERLVRELLRFPPGVDRPEGVPRVLRTGEPAVSADVSDSLLRGIARDEEHLEILRRLAPRSFLVVPLAAQGRTLGAISFASASPHRYGPAERALAEDLAHRAALAIDNSLLYQRVQRAVRVREEVLGMVSHEMRNPLYSILLHVEALFRRLPPEEWHTRDRQEVEAIRASAGEILRLVDDLTDVTRIEAGHLLVRREPEEAGALLEEALSRLRPLAGRSAVRLVSVPGEELPPVLADRPRVLQVLGNLVGNAIRYAPHGGAVTLGAAGEGREVRFWVSDTGPGIAPEHLPHLFERFWQARDARSGSAGLGLAIARGIVEAHGGRIWAESRPGEGSTFHFTLPVAPEGASGGDIGERVRVAEIAEAGEPDAARHVQLPFPVGSGPLVEELRGSLLHALHMGHARTGDRLPSIREVARAFGVPRHQVVRAYEALEAEGLVEKRERSGIYVAPQSRPGLDRLGETAQWLAEVFTQACAHQIRLPYLPDLIRRRTAAVPLRCACIDSDRDTMRGLCVETGQQFGFVSSPVDVAALDEDSLPPEISEADVLLTTVYHAPRVRAVAEALRKPLVVTTMNPDHVDAMEHRLREGFLTVVCDDPTFGERVRVLRGGEYRERVRVVLAENPEEVARLDPGEPVLLTRAAQERLAGVSLRLLVPHSPAFALECARDLCQVIVSLSLRAERR